MPLKTINGNLLVTENGKLATGDDCCCCPCGDATLPWTGVNDVEMTIHFSNSEDVVVCQDAGSELTLNSAEYCEYYSDYDVTNDGTSCEVRIFYIVNGPGCVFVVNGWSTSCPYGVSGISLGGACP